FAYWSFSCQLFLQGIFRLTGAEIEPVVSLGARFVELSNYVQDLLGAWATEAPAEPEAGEHEMPSFPSVVIDCHLDLERSMTPEETFEYMRHRFAQGEELVAELLFH